MRLHELLGGIGVLGWVGDRGVDVSAITHDSRRAARGSCFACITGAVTDGHLYAGAAVDAGAVALLVERELDLPVAQARVADVRAALGPAAAAFYDHPSRRLHCLGVTGTNGKTTVTYLLEAIARAAGQRVGLIGTVGARVDGAPLPLERTTPEADDLQAILARMRDEAVRTVALEVSSHALDQHRVDGTWFAAACFTNLSQDHLDYHGSMDAYFEAKARLFDSSRTAAAAVNVDDRHGLEIARRADDAGLSVLTSDNPRSEDPEQIARAVLEGLRDGPASVAVELDRRAAIRDALSAARPGDVVVIAGKGHETGQTIGDRTVPFDDRVVVREELEALGCA